MKSEERQSNIEIAKSEPGWKEFASQRHRSGAEAETIETYAGHLGRVRRFAGKPLLSLTPEEVENLDDSLVTWAKCYRTNLRTFYSDNGRRDLAMAIIRRKRNTRRLSLNEVMSPNDITSLINVAPDLRDKALIATMAATGARISEIVGLKVRDLVHADENTGYKAFLGKKIKGRERYSCTIDGEYKTMLDAWLAVHPDKRPDSWLFPSTKSKGEGYRTPRHITKSTVNVMLKGRPGRSEGLVKRAEIDPAKKTSPHGFRHFRATLGIMRHENFEALCIGLWGVPNTPMINRYNHFRGLSEEGWGGHGRIAVSLADAPAFPRPAVDGMALRIADLERRVEQLTSTFNELKDQMMGHGVRRVDWKPSQKIARSREAATLLAEGWRVVADLGDGDVVVEMSRRPS